MRSEHGGGAAAAAAPRSAHTWELQLERHWGDRCLSVDVLSAPRDLTGWGIARVQRVDRGFVLDGRRVVLGDRVHFPAGPLRCVARAVPARERPRFSSRSPAPKQVAALAAALLLVAVGSGRRAPPPGNPAPPPPRAPETKRIIAVAPPPPPPVEVPGPDLGGVIALLEPDPAAAVVLGWFHGPPKAPEPPPRPALRSADETFGGWRGGWPPAATPAPVPPSTPPTPPRTPRPPTPPSPVTRAPPAPRPAPPRRSGRLAYVPEERRVEREPPPPPPRHGTIDRSAVLRVIHLHLDEVTWCYQHALGKGVFKGTAYFEWTVTRTGQVIDAQLSKSGVGSEAFARCVLQRLKTWHFPGAEGGDVVIRYPFVLDAAEYDDDRP